MANITKDAAINGTVDTVAVSIDYDGTAGGAYVFTNMVPTGSVIKDITLNTSLGVVLPGTGTLRVAVGGAAAWVTAVTAAAACIPGAIAITGGSPSLVLNGAIHVTAGGTVTAPAAGITHKHVITISYTSGI